MSISEKEVMLLKRLGERNLSTDRNIIFTMLNPTSRKKIGPIADAQSNAYRSWKPSCRSFKSAKLDLFKKSEKILPKRESIWYIVFSLVQFWRSVISPVEFGADNKESRSLLTNLMSRGARMSDLVWISAGCAEKRKHSVN